MAQNDEKEENKDEKFENEENDPEPDENQEDDTSLIVSKQKDLASWIRSFNSDKLDIKKSGDYSK